MLTGLVEPDSGKHMSAICSLMYIHVHMHSIAVLHCILLFQFNSVIFSFTGDGFFYGISVKRNLDDIRSMLGVCPQVGI